MITKQLILDIQYVRQHDTVNMIHNLIKIYYVHEIPR